MDDCALWCDGVWTWKEYSLFVVPVLFVAIAVIYSSYCNDEIEVITGLAFAGLIIGLVGVTIFVLVPIVGLAILSLCIIVFASYFLGKLVRFIKDSF